ncbi:hydrophobin family protein [Aspergillus clavatus NRRL 1]|uniref:Hydrophobin n=1 Tax=Aspergillus clavatus (strain ATCC 1007 / CBS 513.65 / DSM 816 / NCTC 3887 / NRRL 1 / QM 1276 / 107) TaxID=344612 RepID=A1C4B9_ASPCL|nr:hydrophobin, putative [Aspergillus clavatus NRRL 1]EAW15259.1 hydrophobin, putative [Aspergillus clavatus NRRL 1]
MLSRTIFVAIIGAVATVSAQNTGSCNTGTLQCCNQVDDSKNLSARLTGLLDILGIDANNLSGLVGANYAGVAVIGQQSCSAQPVCCTNNNFNGLVALGCTPIDIL